MKTTVSMQEPFSYALWPMVAVGVLILICVGILLFPVIKKMFKRKKTSKPKQVMEVKKVKDISKIKNKYLKELNKYLKSIKNKNQKGFFVAIIVIYIENYYFAGGERCAKENKLRTYSRNMCRK